MKELIIDFGTSTKKVRAAPDLLAVLKRLNTTATYGDSHAPYYTFNEDDAVAIREAIALAEGGAA